MNDTLVKPDITDPDTGEPLISHICRKVDVARAYVTGEPIQALCGKIWVPSRDPENLPVCKRCVEEAHKIHSARTN